MKFNNGFWTFFVIVLLIVSGCKYSFCDTNRYATTISNSTIPFLVVGELALFSDKQEALQGAKAITTTVALTQFLKLIVREKRPNSESLTSFPSTHTSAAFAMATVIADYNSNYTIHAYCAASAIGWSRVEIGAHRWSDVIAGAAIGYFTAKQFTNKRIAISPKGINYNIPF